MRDVFAHSPWLGAAFDLGCRVREGLLTFMAREYPQMLPRLRTQEPGGGASPG